MNALCFKFANESRRILASEIIIGLFFQKPYLANSVAYARNYSISS